MLHSHEGGFRSHMKRGTRLILRLRQIRKGIDMTQAELGRRVGLKRVSINAIELGRSKPSIDVALALARELNTSVEEVMSYVEVPK